MHLQKDIIGWYLVNKRDLPWRKTNNPYLIWLSEIILQQTRVAQGLPYFVKFSEQFPTVKDLAMASEQEVLKNWQGLGYYSRGRNMHASAIKVMSEFDGKFPTAYKDLITLKGVGKYTAAAISSFSVGEQQAVVDGNVMRVLSRFFGIELPIDTRLGIQQIEHVANELIKEVDPSLYNQAIMEFGALMCKPAQPNCISCPLQWGCLALKNNMVGLLPLKSKKVKKKTRFLHYFLIENEDHILMSLRGKGDIWQGLYDLPLLEFDGNVLASDDFLRVFGLGAQTDFLSEHKHVLTHQYLQIQFFRLRNINATFVQNASWIWISKEREKEFPKPIIIQQFLDAYFKNVRDDRGK